GVKRIETGEIESPGQSVRADAKVSTVCLSGFFN
ncbi:MAG: hypothetical protein UU92_C0008G0034, partial [candidate division WWE3 bacterium GW2011_GWA1_42_12]